MSGPGAMINAHETPLNKANLAGWIIYFSMKSLAAVLVMFSGRPRRVPGRAAKMRAEPGLTRMLYLYSYYFNRAHPKRNRTMKLTTVTGFLLILVPIAF